MMWLPLQQNNSKWLGGISRNATVPQQIDHELINYVSPFNAYCEARNDMMAQPKCFDKCVSDVANGASLDSNEKNCIRECVMKQISSRDDLNLLFLQMVARSNIKAKRDYMV